MHGTTYYLFACIHRAWWGRWSPLDENIRIFPMNHWLRSIHIAYMCIHKSVSWSQAIVRLHNAFETIVFNNFPYHVSTLAQPYNVKWNNKSQTHNENQTFDSCDKRIAFYNHTRPKVSLILFYYLDFVLSTVSTAANWRINSWFVWIM